MSEELDEIYEASFTLIGIAGDSKAESMAAIECSKKGDFEGARQHLANADETMGQGPRTPRPRCCSGRPKATPWRSTSFWSMPRTT